ncbi:hypothetical protein [Candidatus Wolbachia massiliensis]|uniref:hypothetical protein n=1 Tax=Candidatus Wolbachia massiliensis TaxID=1845000 RepID=UPI001CD1773B|nr:hypothetical protein [Candidatus Wolbachia massiliensis]
MVTAFQFSKTGVIPVADTGIETKRLLDKPLPPSYHRIEAIYLSSVCADKNDKKT